MPPKHENEPHERAKKRQRVTRACIPCSKRRRKCDGQDPVCSLCLHNERAEDCVYPQAARRRGPPAGYSKVATEASHRVKILQALLGSIFAKYPNLDHDVEQFIPPPPSSSDGTDHFSSRVEEKEEYIRWCNSRSGRKLDEYMSAWGVTSSSHPPKLVSSLPVEKKEFINIPEGMTVSNSSPITSSFSNQMANESILPASMHPQQTTIVSPPNFIPHPSSPKQVSPYFPFSMAPPQSRISADTRSPSSISHPESSSIISFPNMIVNPATKSSNYTTPPPGQSQLAWGPTSNALYFSSSSSPLTGSPENSLNRPLSYFSLKNYISDEGTANSLLHIYFTRSHHDCPIIDKQQLLVWCMTYYSNSHYSDLNDLHNPSIPAELIISVFATVLSSCPHTADTNRSFTALKLLEAADTIICSTVRSPSLGTIQALILLSHIDISFDDVSRANARLGVAIALAQCLGINLDSYHAKLAEKGFSQDYINRTWWSIVNLDILLALRIGRTPILGPQYHVNLPSPMGPEEVDLWLPLPISNNKRSEVSQQQASTTVVRSGSLSTFAELCKILQIASELARHINGLQHESSILPMTQIYDIYERFLRWNMELPSSMKLTVGTPMPNHKIQLTLLYHALCLHCMLPKPSISPKAANEHLIKHISPAIELLTILSENSERSIIPIHIDWCTMTLLSIFSISSLQNQHYQNSQIRTLSTNVGTSEQWRICLQMLEKAASCYDSAKHDLATIRGLPLFATTSGGESSNSGHFTSINNQTHYLSSLDMPMSVDNNMQSASVKAQHGLEGSQSSVNPSFSGQFYSNEASNVLMTPTNNMSPSLEVPTHGNEDDVLNWLGLMQGGGEHEVLSWLGLRGPTRPNSPTNPTSDLLNRWAEQADILHSESGESGGEL